MISTLPLMASAFAALLANPVMVTIIKDSQRMIIVSRDSTKCLQVDPATSALVLQECGPGHAQTIRFLNSRPFAMAGWKVYEAGPIVAGSKCITGSPAIGTRLMAGPCDGSLAQHWTFSSTDPSLRYILRNGQGLCMGAASASDGAPVVMVDCQRGPTRTWNVTSTEQVAFIRNTPQREAAEAQRRQKAQEAKSRWDVLWAIPNAGRTEQEEMERLAGFIDEVLYLGLSDRYRSRYPTWNWARIERMCSLGNEAYCARMRTAVVPSYNYGSGNAGGSSSVTVRTYDQYGNYTGSSTMSRTEAELRGAK